MTMSRRSEEALSIGARPGTDAERWVQGSEPADRSAPPPKATQYTARLTVDITPELRTRIKLAAIAGHVTAAELLRSVLERAFPEAEERS